MIETLVPRLHLVGPLGNVVEPAAYVERAIAAAKAGAGAVHVRLPGAAGGDVLQLTQMLTRATGITNCSVIVNDRVDVALLAGDGVHLGERSIPVGAARALAGWDILIGRSVHDLDGALAAEEDEADYLIAGHIYETGSKHGQAGRGLEWLRMICDAVEIPVIAIGGITTERVPAILEHGAWGVAVGREILEADDPEETASKLLKRLT